MAIYNKFNCFTQDICHKVHNLSGAGDQLTVALCNNANPPSASLDLILSDIVQIAYTNLSSRNVTKSTSGQTGGTYNLVLNDLTLTASGGSVAPFRYVVLYNSTQTSPLGPLICWFDYTSDLTLANGESLTIDFESNGPTTGSLFTLA